MLYRLLRAANRWFALTMFWLYVAMFGLAFSLIFIFPPGTILLLFTGIFGLVVVVIAGQVLRLCTEFCTRRVLSGGTCPACQAAHAIVVSTRTGEEGVEQTVTRCERCGATFTASGRELEETYDRQAAVVGA